MEYEKSVLDFQSFHPREIFMWFDVHGRPLGWHHKFPLTGRQILSEFPDASLTAVFKKKIDETHSGNSCASTRSTSGPSGT